MKGAAGYPEEGMGSERRWTLALAALGLECWVLAALAPRLRYGLAEDGLASLGELLLLATPLAFLGAFVLASGSAGSRGARWAPWVLLVGFPVSLASSVASRIDLTEREAWGPLTTILLGASLVGFLVAALVQLGRPAVLRAATSQPLPPEAHQRPSDAFRNGRTVLGAVLVLSFVGIAVLPFFGGRAETVARFGAAADDAEVLAVIVATLLFSIVVGAIVGPGLRARKRSDPRREQLGRVWPVGAVAAVALLGRMLLYYLD